MAEDRPDHAQIREVGQGADVVETGVGEDFVGSDPGHPVVMAVAECARPVVFQKADVDEFPLGVAVVLQRPRATEMIGQIQLRHILRRQDFGDPFRVGTVRGARHGLDE